MALFVVEPTGSVLETRNLSLTIIASLAMLAVATASPGVALGQQPGTNVDPYPLDYAVDVQKISPHVVQTSPDVPVTISAVVKNTGNNTDTYAISVVAHKNVTITAPAPTLTLAPGETAVVSYQAAPQNPLVDPVNRSRLWLSETTLVVASQTVPDDWGNNSNERVHTWVELPLVLDVTLTDSRHSITGQSVTGSVKVTFLDGSVVPGKSVRVRSELDNPSGLMVAITQRTYVTDANGELDFDLGDGELDHTPGKHTVRALTARLGTSDAFGTAFYRV